MKRLVPLLLLALLPVAGCLKVDQTLSLRADGSGTFDVRYSIPEQTIAQLRSVRTLEQEMAAAAPSAEPAPAPEVVDPFLDALRDPTEAKLKSLLASYKPYGIAVDTVKVEVRNAVRNVQLKVTFASLAELAKADFFRKYGFSLARNAAGNYVMSRARMVTAAGAAAPDPKAVQLLTPMLSGFSVSVRVDTPTTVLESSAQGQGTQSATWAFDFAREPEAVPALLGQDFRIVFDGSGITLPAVSGGPAPAEPRPKASTPAATTPPAPAAPATPRPPA